MNLKEAVARLEALRAEGETLLDKRAKDDSSGVVFDRWRRRWEVSLEQVQSMCRADAPLQSAIIIWPPILDVNTQAGAVAGLMRAARNGIRELRLLATQLGEPGIGGVDDNLPPRPSLADETPSAGVRYFHSGQPFEGAVEIRKLVSSAQRSIFVVDPHISDDTFVLMSCNGRAVSRQFLTLDRAMPSAVRNAWPGWVDFWRHGGGECRAVGRPPLPHGRYLFIDGARYFFDASLKDFGQSFTHFRLLGPSESRENVEPQIAAAWAAATPL